MTLQKIHQYLNLTCKTPMSKLLFLIKYSKKSKKYGSHKAPSYFDSDREYEFPLIFPISVPNFMTIGHYLTSYMTCVLRLTCKRPIPIFRYFGILFLGY